MINSKKHFKKTFDDQLRTVLLVSQHDQIEDSIGRLFFSERFQGEYRELRNNYLGHLLSYKSVQEALWNSARMGALSAEGAKEVLLVKPEEEAHLEKLERASKKIGSAFIANNHVKHGHPPLFLEEVYGNEGAFVVRTKSPLSLKAPSISKEAVGESAKTEVKNIGPVST